MGFYGCDYINGFFIASSFHVFIAYSSTATMELIWIETFAKSDGLISIITYKLRHSLTIFNLTKIIILRLPRICFHLLLLRIKVDII